MALNGLTSVPVEQFGGLNLSADPEEVGFNGALDTLNVTLDPGRVRARDGTAVFASAASAKYLMTWVAPGATILIAVASTAIKAYGYNGAVIASSTSVSGSNATPVAVGTPTASYVYAPSTNALKILRFDTTAWTEPTVPYSLSGPFGVTPDNRIAALDTASGGHRVRFSDNDPGVDWQPNTAYHTGDTLNNAGTRYRVTTDFTSGTTFTTTNLSVLPPAQESFQPNNWVELSPGDGEYIQAMATWNNQLYVFKESKYFVFYGNSTDATGQPVFNYRTVDTGVGALSWYGVAAGPDGVYFVHATGVYRTSGSAPVKISQAIDPFFNGGATSSWFAGGAKFDPRFTQDTPVTWAKGRLFVRAFIRNGFGLQRLLVWDPHTNAWTAWVGPGNPGTGDQFFVMAEMITSNFERDDMALVGSNGVNIYRFDPALSTDAGAVFATSYQTGFSDLGEPAREKTIRETELVGTGSPSLAYAGDSGSLDSPQSVSLGAGPVAKRGLDRYARVGELVSFQLSGNAPWSVSRVVPMLREAAGVGERSR